MRKFPKLEQLSAQKFEQVSNEALGKVHGGQAAAETLSFTQGENTYVTINTDIVGHYDGSGSGTVVIDCGR